MSLFHRGPAGPAFALIERLRKDGAFRRARFTVRGRRDATTLIIGIGQVHPVLQGRFERFQARRIARVQAWIFFACRALTEMGVSSFGQEGLASDAGALLRVQPQLLDQWRASAGSPGNALSFLYAVAARWRRALASGNADAAGREASALNALTLLQMFNPRTSVFPIEQRDVHGVIGAQIRSLHDELSRVEASPPYLQARTKQGRGLTREEYDAMSRRNALVRAFNEVLTHPERDRSIFREVLRAAERRDITVFVLGAAHRTPQLRLARENLPADMLYVWITPPGLWWLRSFMHRLGWLLLAGAALGFWFAEGIS